MIKMTGVDIVVAVCDNIDQLIVCVDNLRRYTDLSLHRLNLIHNGNLGETEIDRLYSLEENGIRVLEKNDWKGDYATINCAIRHTDRDLVLLHAGTIVTSDWLEKMIACAYSDRAIGTVIPFSNAQEEKILSKDDLMPCELSIDEFAGIVERSSLKMYPCVPLVNCFCVYIKREVVQQIGLFDQDLFQFDSCVVRDFYWRAEQMGYCNVLCDNVYVHYCGKQKFLDEKKKIEQNKLLQKRYPKQFPKGIESVSKNVYRYLQKNIDIYTRIQNGKRNILYVLQSDFRTDVNDNIGGTQFHVKDLTMNLRRNNNIFVISRDGIYLRLTTYLENEQITFKFVIGDKGTFPQFYNKEIAKIVDQILSAFSIDLVHIHHLFNLSFDVVDVAKEKKIPVIMSLHDYYYICPTVKLLENGNHYCAGSGSNCVACMNRQLGYSMQIDYLKIWQMRCSALLRDCELLITPSNAAKKVYANCYPEIAERIQVIEHGMDAFACKRQSFYPGLTPGFEFKIEQAFVNSYEICGWAIQNNVSSQNCEISLLMEDTAGKIGEFRALSVNRIDLVTKKSSNKYLSSGFKVQIPDAYFETGDLKVQIVIHNGESVYYSDVITVSGYYKREKTRRRIAFLGCTSEAKGSQIACQIMKQGDSQYDWYVLGGISDPELLTFEKENVYKTGWYKRENVQTILRQNQIDLICILPIWPETFCYTLSEAELAGVPVLATDLGALGDRIRSQGTGWLIRHNATIKEYLNKIDEIFCDEEAFVRVSESINRFTHKSITQMCDEYAKIYGTLPSVGLPKDIFDTHLIYQGYAMCNEDGFNEGIGNKEMICRINELEATLDAINQDIEYRMVKFVNRDGFPFKRQFKWLVRVAYRIYARCFK